MFPFIPRACVYVCISGLCVIITFILLTFGFFVHLFFVRSPNENHTQHTLDRCSCPRPFPLHRQGHGHGFCGVERQVERGKMGRSRLRSKGSTLLLHAVAVITSLALASWALGMGGGLCHVSAVLQRQIQVYIDCGRNGIRVSYCFHNATR